MKKVLLPVIISAFIVFGCESTSDKKEEKDNKDVVEDTVKDTPPIENDTALLNEFDEEFNNALDEVSDDVEIEADTITE